MVRNVVCEVCSRSCRRESSKQRYECVNERQKPVQHSAHNTKGGVGAEGVSSP